ncbi:D-3-phosphoglycerate dehydrogenase [Thermocatellispora tengchongensis]|uniref:D-3-phosphoglycerate dehydrogenase n=1 Tax=Thermocatellispora tengchongensis TaxID=1073253 RepID=A0A840P0K4_9ACTN|nr:NAD(P)-dependent oxidoreductase [Thermocatellispora tengchongensis]MBB5131463.1 D-3-phosphoglycerate dehydrogenase [Thermocatellispora tengchongensis]
MTILVTSRSFSTGSADLVGRLRAAGHAVERGPATHDLDALRGPLGRATGWIAGTGPITEAHLDAAPRLRVIARYGVGVDAVDRAAAARRGIVVTNTPGANSAAVADHTLALILAAVRGVVRGNERVRAGDWSGWRSRELATATVGIIGLGRIGREVVARLSGFGCEVVAHDPYLPEADFAALGVRRATIDEIARECDVVSLHAPGGGTVIDAAWLARSDAPVVVVNTARGDLVDEAALAAALRSGRVSAYAADTLREEGGAGGGPLLAPDLRERVIITPHVAAQTVEAIDRMGAAAVADLLAVLDGRTPANLVAYG